MSQHSLIIITKRSFCCQWLKILFCNNWCLKHFCTSFTSQHLSHVSNWSFMTDHPHLKWPNCNYNINVNPFQSTIVVEDKTIFVGPLTYLYFHKTFLFNNANTEQLYCWIFTTKWNLFTAKELILIQVFYALSNQESCDPCIWKTA